MRNTIFSTLLLTANVLVSPSYAQSQPNYPTSTANESCPNLCIKLNIQSGMNLDLNPSSPGFNSNNFQWSINVTWRPNAPETMLAEAQRIKQKLEDDKTLMITLTEAVAQNKLELARGLAIILAPRLGYKDPQQLLANIKDGNISVGQAIVRIDRKSKE